MMTPSKVGRFAMLGSGIALLLLQGCFESTIDPLEADDAGSAAEGSAAHRTSDASKGTSTPTTDGGASSTTTTTGEVDSPDSGTAPKPDAATSPTGVQFSSGQCYFTSYPEGSHHCVTAPCSITNATAIPATCEVGGGPKQVASYLNFAVGNAIYGTYGDPSQKGEVVALYPDAPSSFPACLAAGADGEVGGELSNPGDYYATGLVVGQTASTELAGFCTGEIPPFAESTAPSFSSSQCYFTSYPEGSHQCVIAPCTVTNAATATPTCEADGSGGYLNFAAGGALYGTYQSGEIVALYPNASSTFPACLARAESPDGGAMLDELSNAGDFYGTGLIVGQATTSELATVCTGAIPTFPDLPGDAG